MPKHAFKAKSSSSQRYVVVEFRTGVELVSSTWLTANDECWGPRNVKDLHASYDDTVKNHVKPSEKWRKFKILRTFGTYDDFETAQRKRQRALEFSDLDTEPENTRRGKQTDPINHSSSDSEKQQDVSSDDSINSTVQRKRTSLGSTRGIESSKNPAAKDAVEDFGFKDNDTLPIDRMQIAKQVENLQATADYQTVTLDRILSFVQKIDRRVTALTMSEGVDADNGVNEWQAKLPLTSVEAVDDVETILLSDETKKKALVCLLKKCGGTTIDDSIRRVLKEVFTNDLGTKYSWKGRRGKKNLSTMALTNVMYTAVQLVPEMTKSKFENRLKEWFRHAPARLLKEFPRNAADQAATLDQAPTD